METLYIKLNIRKSDTDTDQIRNQGLLFKNIAEALALDRNSIEEIDEDNYLIETNKIIKKYSK